MPDSDNSNDRHEVELARPACPQCCRRCVRSIPPYGHDRYHNAERVARESAATKLSLRVLGSNTAAIRLYERHGYLVEGRYVNEFLIDGEYVDDVTLAKFLKP